MSKAHRAPLDSAAIGLVWGHIRDHGRPATRRDAEVLDEARTYAGSGPSPRRVPLPPVRRRQPDFSARVEHNKLAVTRREVLALARAAIYAGHRVPEPRPVFSAKQAVLALPNYYTGPIEAEAVSHDVARLEPIPQVAERLFVMAAMFCGPLTRKQQAEYAFTVAQYGDVIYA